MKIIFIDIDGPLAWGTWGSGNVKIMEGTSNEFVIPYPWVQEDCDALSEIIQKTNAQLVVSSDWKKYYGLYQLRQIFEHYGIGRWNVLDITSNFNPIRKLSSPLAWDRACEINAWVKSYKPSNWIAIDDLPLSGMFKNLRITQWKHLAVQGDYGNGKRLRDLVGVAIEKLNR